MFIPSIMSQGTPDQQAKWMPLCMGLKVIGTYAQTELGHGTFVRGLETTATYDKQASRLSMVVAMAVHGQVPRTRRGSRRQLARVCACGFAGANACA